MPGIKDIAQKAGVSITTVSNVLNGKQNVGSKTKENILRIAKELNYTHPNDKALSRGNGKTIVFHFSDFDTLYYHDILHGISDYAYSKGYDILVSSDIKFKRYSNSCGCIVLDDRLSDRELIKLAGSSYPVVTLDREISGEGIKSIVVNNYASEKQLTERLADAGFKRFAYLGGPDTADNRERFKAFKEVLDKRGIHFKRMDYYDGNWQEESGVQAARLILLSEKMPEVLVCANDMMALGAIRRFHEDGVRIPEDIAVCGFDDIIISRYVRLTTVTVPNYERGYIAAQALIELIEGRGDYETVHIGARVKWRESTGKALVKGK